LKIKGVKKNVVGLIIACNGKSVSKEGHLACFGLKENLYFY
jgi:hypothetical protein